MSTTATNAGHTIEERLGLQATKVELGLLSEPEPVPVGRDERFLVHRQIGRGSMGAVYLADDLRLNRKVALKVVVPHGLERSQLEKRLEREAQALAALRHENVIQVYDLATTNAGELFIAMEYVPGEDLRSWQAHRSLDELLQVYLLAGRGLAAAHERGITHRDFKPDNVLLDDYEGTRRVLVGDFGLAGIAPDPKLARPESERGSLTSTRGLLGTVVYMAPEQLRHERADPRSDQHAFCVALWEAIAGERPFLDEGRSLDSEVGLPARPRVMPRWVHRVLDRGLAFEREDRYPGMGELLNALERRWRWHRASPWVAGFVLVGLVVVGGWWTSRTDPCAAVHAQIAEIWTDEARREIAETFRNMGWGHDEEEAERVVDGLDDAAEGWSEHAYEVCIVQSQTPSPSLERRKICLDRWLLRMDRRVQILREPDLNRDALAGAHELAMSILPGHECELPPIPIDLEVQRGIEKAEESLLMGRGDDALERAEAAVELALSMTTHCRTNQGLGSDRGSYTSEAAAALFRLGYIQAARGEDPSESLRTLGRARLHARACDDQYRSVDALIHTAKILAIDFDRVDEAWWMLEEAVASWTPPEGEQGLRLYEQWKAAGLISYSKGRYQEARDFYERSLQALGEDPSIRPTDKAKLHHNIGTTYHREESEDEALEAYDLALRSVTEVLGDEHPQTKRRVAEHALAVGMLADEGARPKRAWEHFSEVIQYGDPVLSAKAYIMLAKSQHREDAMLAAGHTARRLVAHLQLYPALRDRLLATGYTTAGQVLADLGDPTSIAYLEVAIQRWTDVADANNLGIARFLLANALHALGRDAEARGALDELLADPGIDDDILGEAIQDLEESLSPSPNKTPTTHDSKLSDPQ